MGTRYVICAAGLFILSIFTMSACSSTEDASDITVTATGSSSGTADLSPTTAAALILPVAGPAVGTTTAVDAAREGEAIDVTAPAAQGNPAAAPVTVDRSAFIVPVTNDAPPANASDPPPPDSSLSNPEGSQSSPPLWKEEGCLDTTPVADVTIPDGSIIGVGQAFTKVWRMRNSGNCGWDAALGELQWAFAGGEKLDGPDQVPLADPVPVGSEIDVRVELTAPATPGLYEGLWQARRPDGQPFGAVFWVLIEVPDDGGAATPVSPDAPSIPAAGGVPQPEGVDLGQEVWRLINGERDRQGLYQLAYNPKLTAAAQKHAEDCSQRGECSHTGTDGSDEAIRVQREAYQGSVDESWAWSASPADSVAWWLDEVPPDDWHRRMLLSTYLREIGVGIAPAPSGGHFFVAVFGVPGH